ncbi:putative hydrolase of alkaline phosphatase superfamily [Desulfocurvibacter africanus PCS]|uniref:Putative hydrolase of alkaline phosphatase superfamily n=1 Tax=Desulfocurvibacter africanus PCS TaxID=1262666 RepID=M5PTS0_DESAF|nr:sulfatase-like hydrolase/transferase [Desulfocurvibacter africanus]EMG37425.1 putative hydrolase of alkaline phosphatase superfamily [Desulfocurvibacter africanus PCS]
MFTSFFSVLLPTDRQLFSLLALFGLWSALVSCLAFLPALIPVLQNASPMVRAYLLAATVSHMAMLNAAAVLIASAAYILTRSRTVAWSLAFALMLALNLFLLADAYAFSIFRLHLNAMILSLALPPTGWNSLTPTSSAVLKLALAIGMLLLAQIAGLLWAMRGAVRLNRRALVGLACVLIAIVAVDKATYAYGDLFGRREILQVDKLFQLYQPFTVKRMASKTFGIKGNKGDAYAASDPATLAVGQLAYPLRPIELGQDSARPNIVLVLLDAWRFDMLNEAVTPNLDAFAREHATTFANHYSGGNTSRFGVFSLLYGLPGSYWNDALKQRKGSALMDTLATAGYEFHITSSSDLRWPEFRKTAFVNLAEADIRDAFDTKIKHKRDRILTDAFAAFAAKRALGPGDKPFFYFLLFDSAQSPYSYPEEYEKLAPQGALSAAGGDGLAHANRYRNALRYLDQLCGEILRAVLDTRLATNTILVFTSAHGEEFDELGFLDDSSAFTVGQTKVPMLVFWPGRPPARVERLTSHHDLAPTLLGLLGANNDPQDYSVGQDLFADMGRSYVTSANWDATAYIDGSNVCIFPAESSSMLSTKIRDSENRPVRKPGEVLKRIRPNLSRMAQDMGRFYRR